MFGSGRQILDVLEFSDPGAGSGHACVAKGRKRQETVQIERLREVNLRFRHKSVFLAFSAGLAFGLFCSFFAILSGWELTGLIIAVFQLFRGFSGPNTNALWS